MEFTLLLWVIFGESGLRLHRLPSGESTEGFWVAFLFCSGSPKLCSHTYPPDCSDPRLSLTGSGGNGEIGFGRGSCHAA